MKTAYNFTSYIDFLYKYAPLTKLTQALFIVRIKPN